MNSNTFGKIFSLTSFGESHGKAIGGIIDGCPAGISIDVNAIQLELDRRKPGQSKITTQRKEADQVVFLSGLFEGKTLGSPISFQIMNSDQKSKDYSHIKDVYRPSHSDYTYDAKYGTRDYIIKEAITNDTLDLNIFLDFITRDEKRFKYKALLDQQGYDTRGLRSQDLNANYLPSENIRIPVNKENVISNNIVNSKDANEIVDEIIINIKGQALYKNRLLMLDIIASNEWNRPIYFSGGAFGDEDYIWMK